MSKYLGRAGKYLTTSLFVEKNKRDADSILQPVFSLQKYKHNDRTGILSLRKIYMDCGDPTGYLPAMEAFGSWEHWQVLKNLNWFAKYLDAWEAELRAKIISESVHGIISTACDVDDKRSLQAQRYLANEGWVQRVAGRPSNSEILKNELRHSHLKDLISEDSDRLGL